MKAKKDELTKIIQDVSVKLYQQAQAASQAAGADGQADGSAKADDNTVDGDFKEVDPEDK